MVKKCSVCRSQAKHVFSSTLLKKYDVKYFLCEKCELLQTEKPYWLDEAYSEAISLSDTGLLARNIELSKKLVNVLRFWFGSDFNYLDVAGGYGVLTRLMRDAGFSYYWHDEYTANIFAKGFEYSADIGEIELLTAFEVIEHLYEPIEFIEQQLAQYSANSILFSTELYNVANTPRPSQWWYLSEETGQHISFYTVNTLRYMAKKLGKNVIVGNNIILLTNKRISPIVFRLLVGRVSQYLNPLFSIGLNSQTQSDSQRMLGKIDNDNKDNK